jgi:type III secretion system chaperone SycN
MLIEQSIEEFGASIGLPGLALDGEGRLAMAFGDFGTLFLEKAEGESYGESVFLLYLARDHGVDAAELALRALEACHPRRGLRPPVNPAIGPKGELVFAIRLDEREVDLPTIESSLQLLKGLHDAMRP